MKQKAQTGLVVFVCLVLGAASVYIFSPTTSEALPNGRTEASVAVDRVVDAINDLNDVVSATGTVDITLESLATLTDAISATGTVDITVESLTTLTDAVSEADLEASIASVTAGTGTAFALFPTAPAKRVWVGNNSGTVLEVRRGGSGAAYPIQSAAEHVFKVSANANELGIRRVDQGATEVTAELDIENY